jgi:glucose/arabinose dehydrogenase
MALKNLNLKRVVLLLVVTAIAIPLGILMESGYWQFTTAEGLQSGLREIQLPPGFHMSLYAHVPSARQMALSPAGTLFVGTRTNEAPHLPMQQDGGGIVYAIPDADHNGVADEVIPLTHGLNFPNGVAFKDGALYVGEIQRITRYDDIEAHLKQPPKPVVVNDSFSSNAWHGWKYIRFGPDGWLYVPVGAPCNVCLQKDPRFGTIMRIKPDGTQPEVFAKGIRNSVGYDWDSKTHDLWFTDNGRDLLGDNAPPDELNHAPTAGMNFGFPFCHGKGISDPEFGKGHNCSQFTACEVELGPHHAALGMRFYNGTMFPPQYRGDIFIAEHGSWNSSKKVGYQIARVHFENGKPVKYEPFATGFLQPGDKVWGRPVDVLVANDGALLVSDDFAGAIYRITYDAKLRS